MKYISLLLLYFFSSSAFSQKKDFRIYNLSLPPELSYYDNQFSSLYIHQDKLFLMSESRLQDSAEAKLYAIKLTDLEHKMADSSFILPFRKFHIYNIEVLRDKMKMKGDEYEGLEAMVIDGNEIYFSVETTTPSDNCYLLKGQINDTAVILNDKFPVPMPKPVMADNSHVYNAGFEALALIKKGVYGAFFEYNYFTGFNYARRLTTWSFKNNGKYHAIAVDKLPYRITDITKTGKNKFTAINYFYKGGGADTIYRVPKSDTVNDRLIRDSSGYHSYSRLVELKRTGTRFSWQPLWEFPQEYRNHNWEGIAAYKNGYFVINDKYTAARPYSSALLYLREN